MRAYGKVSAFLAAAIFPLALSGGSAAAAPSSATAQCNPISIHYAFDNDQTGGWWVVTTTMSCSPASYYKRYELKITDRPFTKYFTDVTTPKITGTFTNRTIVPATPPSENKSACVNAKSELYFFDGRMIDSEARNLCFKTHAP